MHNGKTRTGKDTDPVIRELQLIKKNSDLTNDLLRDLLITRLGIACVPQLTIRQIAGVDIRKNLERTSLVNQ
jgi:hypothetical protein